MSDESKVAPDVKHMNLSILMADDGSAVQLDFGTETRTVNFPPEQGVALCHKLLGVCLAALAKQGMDDVPPAVVTAGGDVP